MRYIKVLVLAIFLFFVLLFFFQNQAPLSQAVELELNLFYLQPMKSMPLPIYFIVLIAFFAGCALAVLMLAWDKVLTSSRLVKTRWANTSLRKENSKLQEELEALKAKTAEQAVAHEALPAKN